MATGAAKSLVAGVILAAGESRRFGAPKQLLDICGEPMLRRVVRIARASTLGSIIVVLGSAAEQVRSALAGCDVEVVVNPDFASGQASSLREGIAAVPGNAAAVLVLLGDQPTMAAKTIDAIIGEYASSRVPLVQARYRGDVPGHPVLIDSSLFPELTAVSGDQGARGVLRAHADEIRFVDVDSDPPPDIDTEAAYRDVIERIRSGQAK